MAYLIEDCWVGFQFLDDEILTFVGGTWKKSSAFVIEFILSRSIL